MAAPLREEPWSEQEINFLLSEIVKHSRIPSQALLGLIGQYEVQPAWNYIFVPHGRTLHSCQSIYSTLPIRRYATAGPTGPLVTQAPPIQMQQVPRKRPPNFGETPPSSAGGRQLQPRPSFTPMNTNGEDPNSQLSPASGSDSVHPGRKKRGRPTKAEAEQRRAEAIALGKPYPQQRTPKTPKALQPSDGGQSVESEGSTAAGGSMGTPATSRPPTLSTLAPAPAPSLASAPPASPAAPFIGPRPRSPPAAGPTEPDSASRRKRVKKSDESSPMPLNIGGPSPAISGLSAQTAKGQITGSPGMRSPAKIVPRGEGSGPSGADVTMTGTPEAPRSRPSPISLSGPSAGPQILNPPDPAPVPPANPVPQAQQTRPEPQEAVKAASNIATTTTEGGM